MPPQVTNPVSLAQVPLLAEQVLPEQSTQETAGTYLVASSAAYGCGGLILFAMFGLKREET